MWLGLHPNLRHSPAEVFHMAAESLRCRECGEESALDARYVCERCFGPLEVAYAQRPEIGDVGAARRRIQGGPQNIWRYADFLPLEAPPGPSSRRSSRFGLPAGCTPLIRADRLAERLGVGGGGGKNDAAHPPPPFKDPVVSVARAPAPAIRLHRLARAPTGNPAKPRAPP